MKTTVTTLHTSIFFSQIHLSYELVFMFFFFRPAGFLFRQTIYHCIRPLSSSPRSAAAISYCTGSPPPGRSAPLRPAAPLSQPPLAIEHSRPGLCCRCPQKRRRPMAVRRRQASAAGRQGMPPSQSPTAPGWPWTADAPPCSFLPSLVLQYPPWNSNTVNSRGWQEKEEVLFCHYLFLSITDWS